MLLLKATSHATIYCLSQCLSMLQQQQIAPAQTPSLFHSASSASSSGGVLSTRKTSTMPSVQYYDYDVKKRYVICGYFPLYVVLLQQKCALMQHASLIRQMMFMEILIASSLTPEVQLTFRGPCIVIYSYNRSQQDAIFLNFILLKKNYMFWVDSLSVISICETVVTAIGICCTGYADCQ